MKLSDLVIFNPKRPLKKGESAAFVEMAALPENGRDINRVDEKIFTGGGSKFANKDTLFARITPCLENGKTSLVSGLSDGEVAFGSTEFIVLAAKEPEYDSDYIYYLSRLGEFRSFARSRMEGTSGRQRVAWQSLADYEYDFPDKRLRKFAGDVLKKFDDKILLNHQINQTFEQMAQALFKSWFVDFEPVKAKMAALEAGGSQEDATLAAMTAISGKDADALAVFEREHPEQYTELKATAELFPSAMQDSELGALPEGWKLQPFGELLSHTIGGDWGKDEPDDKHKIPVRIIRGTDIPNIKSCQDGNVPFRYVEEKKLKARSLNAGDIVIEVSGGSPTQPTGRSIYITDDILKRLSLPVEPASFCRLFRPKSMELGMILGLHLEKIYQDGKTWLYQNQSTGISNFQTKVFLENEMVAIASSEVLKAFYKVIFPFIKFIHSSENIKLTQLRDTLLPILLSGEITLPEAEQIISEEA